VLGAYPDRVEAWRLGRTTDRRTNVGKKKLKERAHLIDREISGTGSTGPGKPV